MYIFMLHFLSQVARKPEACGSDPQGQGTGGHSLLNCTSHWLVPAAVKNGQAFETVEPPVVVGVQHVAALQLQHKNKNAARQLVQARLFGKPPAVWRISFVNAACVWG